MWPFFFFHKKKGRVTVTRVHWETWRSLDWVDHRDAFHSCSWMVWHHFDIFLVTVPARARNIGYIWIHMTADPIICLILNWEHSILGLLWVAVHFKRFGGGGGVRRSGMTVFTWTLVSGSWAFTWFWSYLKCGVYVRTSLYSWQISVSRF